VLVEADTVDQLTRQQLPRRPHVVVIAHDLDDATIYTRAAAVGAEYGSRSPRRAHRRRRRPPRPHRTARRR
jgi:hypothetical protein